MSRLTKIELNLCDNPAHNEREYRDLNRAIQPLAEQINKCLPLQDFLSQLPYNESFLCRVGDSVCGVIQIAPRGNGKGVNVFPSGQQNLTEHLQQLTELYPEKLLAMSADRLVCVSLSDAGFRRVGQLTNDVLIEGEWRDMVIFEYFPNLQHPEPQDDEEDEDEEVEIPPQATPRLAKKLRQQVDDLDGIEEDIKISKE